MNLLFEQLPLAIQLRDDATFENFYAGKNTLLLEQLSSQLSSDHQRYIFIFGRDGVGRSHLLQAACHQAASKGLSSVYLPLKELIEYSPAELFDGLHHLDLVCLDDIESILGSEQGELALFSLFNRLADKGAFLLISAFSTVRELDVQLPDLASRLSWGSIFQLHELSDDDRIKVLQLRAEKRGIELNNDVAHYIFHRCKRDMTSLLAVLDNLDKVSLREQRRLTVPFIKSVLNW